MRIGASSRLLAVIGDPVAHSLSPDMQNAAITALGLDAVYVAIRVEPPGVAHVIRAFEAVGVAGNVTVPHKLDVARLLIRLTPIAAELETVNTFWPEGERLLGDNTDVQGVLDAVGDLEADGPWLLAGTGGAARAVAAAARERDVTLLVRSREPEHASRFVAWGRELGLSQIAVDDGRSAGVAINATPLGLRADDEEPFPADRLERGTAALDLVYAPGGTRWIRSCRERGLRAEDGRTMLVAQGARAFERFFSGHAAPRAVMAAAVEQALER